MTAWDSVRTQPDHLLAVATGIDLSTNFVMDGVNTDGFWLPFASGVSTGTSGTSNVVSIQSSNDNTNFVNIQTTTLDMTFTSDTTLHVSMDDNLSYGRWIRFVGAATAFAGSLDLYLYLRRIKR